MPFSSGVYTLPNPALVTGEVVSATENNTTRNDIAGAFNLTMLRNGTSTATANLPMGGYKLTGLGAPSTNGDSLAYGAAAVVTTLTSTSLTATRVPYAGTGGLLQDASTFTFDGTTLTAGGFSTAGSFTLSGGTANGVAYLNGSKVLTTGSALQFDGSNLGLGVTPSAWGTYKAFQMQNVSVASNVNEQYLSSNAYFDGANWKYVSATAASQYRNNQGTHSWYTAPSGTAGNAISFTQAMTLDASGNLGIGSASPTAVGSYRVVELNGAAGSYISLKTAATETGRVYSDGSQTVIEAKGARPIWFATNGNERMRIDSSGNVGIGTTDTSTQKLFVNNSVAGQAVARFYGNYVGSGTVPLSIWARTGGAVESIIQYNDAATAIQFGTTTGHPLGFLTSGTERMRIDSSGNVGIGTSSPISRLSVNGYLNSQDSSNNGAIYLGQYLNANGAYGGFEWNNTSGLLTLRTQGAYPVTFGTNATERMRIDSSGNLLVGTTTAGYTSQRGLTLAGSADASYVSIGHANGVATGNSYAVFSYNGGIIGSISQNGTTAVAYNTSSDYRLKENIQPMQNALDVVAQLNPVTYTWKADGSDGQGFIAHELQAVVPDCVTGEKDAVDEDGKPVYQGIDTSFLVATLCKAIQELEARVKQLEGK